MTTPPSPIKRGKSVFGNPESEKTFETPYGAFTLRRPSIATQLAIHKEVARELEGLTNIDSFGEMWYLWVATVTVCARRDDQKPDQNPAGFPEDFAWNTAYDADWLPTLFKEFNDWVQSFRKPKESSGDQEGSVGRGGDQVVPDQSVLQTDADRSPVSVADGS